MESTRKRRWRRMKGRRRTRTLNSQCNDLARLERCSHLLELLAKLHSSVTTSREVHNELG